LVGKGKRVYIFLERELTRRRYTLMRELQVLTDGHLKLDFAERKEFFE
jgi:hypothetical protein